MSVIQFCLDNATTGQNIHRKFENQSWFLHLTCLKEWGDGERYHLKPRKIEMVDLVSRLILMDKNRRKMAGIWFYRDTFNQTFSSNL